MTNWDLIRKIYPNVTKNYVISNFALVKDIYDNVILQLCNATYCNVCLLDNDIDCRQGLVDYLEKEVNENE